MRSLNYEWEEGRLGVYTASTAFVSHSASMQFKLCLLTFKALSTLERIVAEFGDSRRFRRQIVAKIGDCIVSSVDRL